MILTALFAAGGCASVAAVVLDIPERSEARDGGSAPARPVEVQDTVRPPIERVRNPDSVLALLPLDSGGNVDWVTALRTGVVAPRPAPPGVDSDPDLRGFRFDFKLKGPNEMFDALFPHSAHVEWLSCASCHPTIFPYQDSDISMQAINQGEACGRCHGPVAFPVSACFRCHSAMPVGGRAEPTLGDEIVLARSADTTGLGAAGGAALYPPARFSHWVHRIRYRCSACHPALFAHQAGADTILMAEMQRGGSCGACHNGTGAFSVMQCAKCHVEPDGGGDSLP